MNKKLLSFVPLCIFYIPSASAVMDGTPLNWEIENNKVEMNCTGTIISGKWVLTAAHCTWPSAGGLRDVTFSPAYIEENTGITTLRMIEHPDFETDDHDVSLWELSGNAAYSAIDLLTTSKPAYGDQVELVGFGGTRELGLAKMEATDYLGITSRFFMKDIGQGYSAPGDSGAPISNESGHIFAINSSDYGSGTWGGAYVDTVKDFIVETVNAWHFPTRIDLNGSGEVVIQSLHVNDVADGAYTEGDVVITGGTCFGESNLAPFETCTYEIDSQGGEGALVLSESARIEVNHQFEDGGENPDIPTNPGGGGGGSSMGILGLGLLGMLAYVRRKFIKA